MIPSFGLPFGPVAVLVLVDVLFVSIVHGLFLSVLLDRPQLPARRLGAIAEVFVVLALAAAALVAPFEGERSARCPGAFATYGFSTDALAAGGGPDPCAFGGQLLVTFSWATLVVVAIVVAVWRWSGDS